MAYHVQGSYGVQFTFPDREQGPRRQVHPLLSGTPGVAGTGLGTRWWLVA